MPFEPPYGTHLLLLMRKQKPVTSQIDLHFLWALESGYKRQNLHNQWNIEACQLFVMEHGAPRPGHVIWAYDEGDEVQISTLAAYYKALAPGGVLSQYRGYCFTMGALLEQHVISSHCSLSRNGYGSSSGNGSNSSTSGRPSSALTKPPAAPTNKLKVAIYKTFEPYVYDKTKPTDMHQMFAKIRLSSMCGGDVNDVGCNITIVNDTSSSIQVIEDKIWEACISGKEVRKSAIMTGSIISGTDDEPRGRRYVPTEIRLFRDPGRTDPLTDWIEEQACTVPDAPPGQKPHYFSGKNLRRSLTFATPKGNQCLIVGTDAVAVANTLKLTSFKPKAILPNGPLKKPEPKRVTGA